MKALRSILSVLFFTGGILFVLLWLDPNTPPPPIPDGLQRAPVVHAYFQQTDQARLETLTQVYGYRKTLPPGFELQALVALSHYPELASVPVRFELAEALVPLASRPDPVGVLFPWVEREYCVVISEKSLEILEPILLKHLPYNAQIGVIGHELAHTVHYLDKNSLQLAWTAIAYLSPDFRKSFERETDQRAISYGLGYPLLDWATYVNQQLSGKIPGGQSIEDAYLSPDEIKKAIADDAQYQSLPEGH